MIITISNEYGTGAVAIARDVAAALGYEVIDEQLPVVVAKRLDTSPEAVEAAEDTRRSVGERILSGLEMATPEVAAPRIGETFDDQLVREVQTAVREFAAHGNVVLFGRGASAILGRRADVLRIYLHAPRDWRIHHIVEIAGVDEKIAAAEVDRIDAARRAYVAKWYQLAWGAADNYDLSLDTATFGHGAVHAIVAAVRART